MTGGGSMAGPRATIHQRQAARHFARVLATIVVTLAFATGLYYAYKLGVAPYYGYLGLTYREPDPVHYTTALLAVVVTAIFLPHRVRRVPDFILWVVFILGAAPSILLAQYSTTLSHDEATTMGLHITGCMLLVRFLAATPTLRRLPLNRLRPATFWTLIGAGATLFYAYLAATAGISVNALSFSDVYDVRSDFGFASSGDRILAYGLPLVTGVLNPLLMARGLFSGRWLFFAAGAAGEVIVYTTTGHKSVLFTVVAVAGLAAAFRRSPRLSGLALLTYVTLAATVSYILDWVTDTRVWSSMLVRRVMIIPGSLTAAYVAIFYDRERQNFAEVLPFITNPYSEVRPVYLVGAVIYGDPTTAANVNLFGHGYLNGGYLGMYIEAAVLAGLLWLAAAATRNLPTPVACLVFFNPSLAVISSSIFTTILTHGFAAAIVLCALAPSTGWGRPPSRRTGPATNIGGPRRSRERARAPRPI